MPEWLQQVISSFVGAGVGTTAVGWYIKTRIEAGVRERHMRLEADLQSQLERSKSELARFSVEHQVRFSHLHTKRAEIIAEGYQKIWFLYTAVKEYTSVSGPIYEDARQEQREKVVAEIVSTEEYCLPRLIYLPEDSAQVTSSILLKLRRSTARFIHSVDVPLTHMKHVEWANITEELEGEIKELLGSLGRSYRSLLDSNPER